MQQAFVFRLVAGLIMLFASPASPLLASRRALLDVACLTAASSTLPAAFAAAPVERPPPLKEVVAYLDKMTPPEMRNEVGDAQEHLPQITFGGRRGNGGKVVFVVPHENLGLPNHVKGGYTQYMWLKNEDTGEYITAKQFRASDPDPTITAYVGAGTKVTAASVCSLHGQWQGTFRMP